MKPTVRGNTPFVRELAVPPCLRTFLDAGCDITTVPGWRSLAQSVHLFDGDDQYRKTCVDAFRRWAAKWVEQSHQVGDIGIDQAGVTRYLWQAEALEDPALANRLFAALPERTRAEFSSAGEVRSPEHLPAS
jgi:hypothetical protein